MLTTSGHRPRFASLVADLGRRRRPEPSQLLVIGIGALLIALFNPWTIEGWLRSRHVSPGASLRAWCWDLAVLAVTLGALTVRRATRPYPNERAPRVAVKVVAVIAGLLLSTLALEGILRLRPGDALPESLRKELRWRARHASGSILTDPINEFSRTLGWEVRPNLRTDGITSNSAGLRGLREYSWEPRADQVRVLCVGDSFTFGEHLRDEETMPVRLEAELNQGSATWEVLNLGVVAYGTDQQWLRLSEKGLRYKPSIVVLGFFEENLDRNVLSFRDYAKPYFLLRHGQLVLQNVPVPAPEELLARPPKFPPVYLASFLGTLFGDLRSSFALGNLAGTEAGRVTLAILEAMRERVVGSGGVLVLMTIPRPIRPRGGHTEEMLAEWAQRTETPFLNLRTAYLALPPQAREHLYGGHWTPYGASVSARFLAEKLRRLTPH
jgi:hypothetical protein